MKSLCKIMALLVMIILSAHTYAQSKMTEGQKQEMKARYDAYKERLNLTEDQSKQVQEINSSYFRELFALRDAGGSKLSKYRKYKAIQSEKDRQMKGILDKGQYKQYKQFQKEMKKEFKENRKG